MMKRILGLNIMATLPSLSSAGQANEITDVNIAYDCWGETVRAYGKHEGQRVSDMKLLTGLDAARHKLVSISACTDMKTRLISGVTTTYAIWEGAEQNTLLRMNLLGRVSEYYQYDDNAVLKAAGLQELNDDQKAAFDQYWL